VPIVLIAGFYHCGHDESIRNLPQQWRSREGTLSAISLLMICTRRVAHMAGLPSQYILSQAIFRKGPYIPVRRLT
jgi:hypothetical protein